MDVHQEIKQTGPLTLTIFGITGDLSGRMLLPALYDLAKQNLLPNPTRIIGLSRHPGTIKELLAELKQTITQKDGSCDERVLKELGSYIELIKMDLNDAEGYHNLRQRLDKIEDVAGVCMNRLFYLAIPPKILANVATRMGQNGLNQTCPHGTGQSRLLVEKPFGHDLKSAKDLIERMKQYFGEQQIFRIDHFLAKETAQNILTFRFKNALFNAVWDKKNISQIVVSAVESIDIEGRASFYEQTGALRDMIQSHLLQILALVTMEVPEMLSSEAIHAAKLKLLTSIKPLKVDQALRGQYDGYTKDVKNPKSRTETFAVVRLNINNRRWRNVPILLKTGKALDKKSSTITVTFSDDAEQGNNNQLIIRIAPNEGISLQLSAKKPGFDNDMQEVDMDFSYQSSFAEHRQPTAYERVLVDAFRGDQTLFATSQEVLASWKIVDSLAKVWQKSAEGLHAYKKGSLGPDTNLLN